MTTLLLQSLLASLVGSPHCVGMCGPLLAASPGGHRNAWHAGRGVTYVALGLLAGTLGLGVPGALRPWLLAAAVANVAVAIAGWVGPFHLPLPRTIALAKAGVAWGGPAGAFAFGMASGALPCGLVAVAVGFAVATGSPLGGLTVLVGFWVGTLPALVGTSGFVQRALARAPAARPAAALAWAAATWWFVASRAPEVPCHMP